MKESEIEKNFPLLQFTALLRAHVQCFREMDGLQKQVMQKSEQAAIEGLQELIGKFAGAVEALQKQKEELRPLFEQLSKLDTLTRQKLLSGEAEGHMADLEGLAQGIQGRHLSSFEPPHKTPEVGLDNLVNLYRGLN